MLDELIYSILWYRHETFLCNAFIISRLPATQLKKKLAWLPNKKEIVPGNAAFVLKEGRELSEQSLICQTFSPRWGSQCVGRSEEMTAALICTTQVETCSRTGPGQLPCHSFLFQSEVGHGRRRNLPCFCVISQEFI